MASELFLVSIAITLLVLSVILVALLSGISRNLAVLSELMRDIRREMAPMIGDLRTISLHAATMSESIRTGMDGVERMGKAVGNIGDDLEVGRKAVRGGLNILGALFGPWMAKFKN